MSFIFFQFLILLIIKRILCDSPDYSKFTIKNSNFQCKFLKMFFLKDRFQMFQLTENGFEAFKYFEGSSYNTE